MPTTGRPRSASTLTGKPRLGRFSYQIPIDLWSTSPGRNGRSAKVRIGQGAGQGIVRAYRFAPRPDGACRLVLDLAAPLTLIRQELGTPRAPQLAFGLGSVAASGVCRRPSP